MKKLFFFALVAFAISCSKNVETDESQTLDQPSERPEMVTVSFAVKGDVAIEEDPLTISRVAGEETESRDLYGIVVYYDEDRSGKIDDYYGWGLFDNVDDMIISLLSGYKYQFICTLIKNGKDIIIHSNERSNQYTSSSTKSYYGSDGYMSPFGYIYCYEYTDKYIDEYRYYGVELKNEFKLGSDYEGLSRERLRTGLIEERAQQYNGKFLPTNNYYPQTDRYYGEVTDYSPKEGGVVNIELKRCVFGVKFVITGVTDGTFLFEIHDTKDCEYSGIDRNPNSSYSIRESVKLFSAFNFDIKADTTFKETLYTYRRVFECWRDAITDKDYSENFTLDMTWIRGNGVTQTLDPLTLTFKRNILTTVNIRLNGGDINNSFNLNVENTEMGEENKDFDVDAGDMTDTPVEPTE